MKLQSPFFHIINDSPAARRLLRAAAILLAVALLHLLAGVLGSRLGGRAEQPSPPNVVTVSLQAPAPPAPPPPPPKPRPKPLAPHPKPTPPEPSAALPPVAAPAAESLPVVTGNQDNRGTDNSSEDANAGSAASEPAVVAGTDTPDKPAPAPPKRVIDAPPSVTLKYDVQGLRDGQKVYGSGKIVWRNQDGGYRIDGSASVLFFTLLQFSSEGTIDDFGVSPALYTEKRFHKTATDTRFEHARNTITFSASDNSYPLPGDAQDRASIIWQLATIGRGNPAAFFTGAEFRMFVAGVRDAEPWQIIVSGLDDDIDGGESSNGNAQAGAWHLVRMPRPGSYDQKIDIWLAPRQQWYPVKIRYTENNGDVLEMSLSSRTSP